MLGGREDWKEMLYRIVSSVVAGVAVVGAAILFFAVIGLVVSWMYSL